MRITLVGLFACLWLAGPAGAAPAAEDADEQVLKEARVATDGAGLLAFIRGRTVEGADESRLKALVRQLGDDDFEKREEASQKLVAIGARAKPFLHEGLRDRDIEIVRRSQECLKQIERGGSLAVVSAAVRLTARRKPDGAALVLLGYLPSAEDEYVAEEVRTALAALAVRGGKADPALVAALKDPVAARRAAAGAALCAAGLPAYLPAVRRLLHDPAPEVRLRVGLALAGVKDKAAVPVLIALLDRLPAQSTGRVEELLYRLAGDKAPVVLSGDDETSRRKFRAAWEGWWKEHGAGVDGARLGEASRTLGFTLVVLLDRGKVLDLDAANRPRLEIEGLEKPLDAQLLPGDRVLVAEHDGGRVTERNRKGEVVWEKKIVGPLAAQRLSNGHTFIATQREVVEVDRSGKVVSSYSPPGGASVMKAQRLANGDIALVTQLGVPRYVRVDRDGKELKSFGVDLRTSGGRIDVLPNGHVLVPEMSNNRVVEFDGDGKVVWEARAQEPIAAVRLPNGHTLVTSMSEHRAVELNRAGKEVWEYKTDTRVTRAFRR